MINKIESPFKGFRVEGLYESIKGLYRVPLLKGVYRVS